MTMNTPIGDRALDASRQKPHYALRLYVAGTTARSILAIRNIQHICGKHLADRVDLEVIDIYQHPQEAARAQIIAAPTLIKMSPEPIRRAIGDLSNEVKVMAALDLVSNVTSGS